jgi:hypothetical protein
LLFVEIDEVTPCLKDTRTGEIVQTEVIEITRKSFLRKYNRKTGWYVAWDKLLADNRVFALVIEGSVDIQGLIAIKNDIEKGCVFISWAVAAPHNNLMISAVKKYSGVGGHLFAIAIDKSIEHGFGGVVSGFAANRRLQEHYIDVFKAKPLYGLHPYQIVIEEETASKIKEEYTYEWTDDKW